MRGTPYITLQLDAIAGLWILDPDYGPLARDVDALAAWLAESCEREWLW